MLKFSLSLKENIKDIQKALELMLSVPSRAYDSALLNSIEGYRGNISKIGRLLLHEWWTVVDKENKAHERYLFLFKSRILICKVRKVNDQKSIFVLQDFVKLPDCLVEEDASQNLIRLTSKPNVKDCGSLPICLKPHKDDKELRQKWYAEICSHIDKEVTWQEHRADDLRIDSTQVLEDLTLGLPQKAEAYNPDTSVRASDVAKDYFLTKEEKERYQAEYQELLRLEQESIQLYNRTQQVQKSIATNQEASQQQSQIQQRSEVVTRVSQKSDGKEQTTTTTTQSQSVQEQHKVVIHNDKIVDQQHQSNTSATQETKTEVVGSKQDTAKGPPARSTPPKKITSPEPAKRDSPKKSPPKIKSPEPKKEPEAPVKPAPEVKSAPPVDIRSQVVQQSTEIVKSSDVNKTTETNTQIVQQQSTEARQLSEADKALEAKLRELKQTTQIQQTSTEVQQISKEVKQSTEADRHIEAKLKEFKQATTVQQTTEVQKSLENQQTSDIVQQKDTLNQTSIIKTQESSQINQETISVQGQTTQSSSVSTEATEKLTATAEEQTSENDNNLGKIEMPVQNPALMPEPMPIVLPRITVTQDIVPRHKTIELTDIAGYQESMRQVAGGEGTSGGGGGPSNVYTIKDSASLAQWNSRLASIQQSRDGFHDGSEPPLPPLPPHYVRMPGFFQPLPRIAYETSIEILLVKSVPLPPPPITLIPRVVVHNEALEMKSANFLEGIYVSDDFDNSLRNAKKKIRSIKSTVMKSKDSTKYAVDTVNKASSRDFIHIFTPPIRHKRPIYEIVEEPTRLSDYEDDFPDSMYSGLQTREHSVARTEDYLSVTSRRQRDSKPCVACFLCVFVAVWCMCGNR